MLFKKLNYFLRKGVMQQRSNIKKSPQPQLNIMFKTYLENVLRTSKKMKCLN